MPISTYFLGTDANERFDVSGLALPNPVYVDGQGGNDYIAGHR